MKCEDLRPQLQKSGQNANGVNRDHAIFYLLYINLAGCQEFTDSLHNLHTLCVLSVCVEALNHDPEVSTLIVLLVQWNHYRTVVVFVSLVLLTLCDT